MGKVRETQPVRFSYNGQPVDSRARGTRRDIQFWVRTGAHWLTYGVLSLLLVAALDATGLRSFPALSGDRGDRTRGRGFGRMESGFHAWSHRAGIGCRGGFYRLVTLNAGFQADKRSFV